MYLYGASISNKTKTTMTVHVLVNFYASRLSDQTSVPYLMTGLVALTHKFDQFNTSCTKSVLNG